MSAHLTIAVTDACGSRRNFQAAQASLDCGAGSLAFKAGSPTYSRKFDNALLTIFHPEGDTLVLLHNCTASLSADALHILCEDFQEKAGGDRSAGLKFFPAEWPEIPENTSAKNEQNHK